METSELPVEVPNLIDWFLTGSRVICDPPPTDTDQDIMVLVERGALGYVHSDMEANDWELGGSYIETDKWRSYKSGIYNILVTDDPEYFEAFRRATDKAKELNLLKKEDRIKLFTEILSEH